ncbi:hypothetical protein B9Z55_027872 [Caenorhabditis nigoni]|uniref:Uncharacterized protein n=1 Tax=Caenorhabditis nigoni TaxID=1611254 RepID=A0A2G5SE67_9PELO|nr:hypothetical protein B9Z55_027872 [Caenorhabditis nigoni]
MIAEKYNFNDLKKNHQNHRKILFSGRFVRTNSIPTFSEYYAVFLPVLNAAHQRLVSEVKQRENTIEAKDVANQTLMGNVLQYMKDLVEKNANIVELQSHHYEIIFRFIM